MSKKECIEQIVMVSNHCVFMPMKSNFTAEFYTAVEERLLPWLAT